MKAKTRLSILLLLLSCALQAPVQAAERPSLVLTVVVDQMRYDYLDRYRDDFSAGLKRVLEQGAVFTDAQYDAAPTVTAVGHSTVLTGASPALSGIAGNSWYSRSDGRYVESITDFDITPLGTEDGASPHRLRVSTVGDELKLSGFGGKVYGVSLKDRGAILPAGHMADGAFWLENGRFVSSAWYFDALPAWATAFNAEQRADAFAGREWMGTRMPAEPGPGLYRSLDSTPFADELVLDFALRILESEALGTTAATDLLTVSFSAMDYQGHANGPDTAMMRAMVLSIDEKLGRLLAQAEAQAGEGKVLLVMTADHGVSPVPEENIARQLPGGRYDAAEEARVLQEALQAAFGDGDYVLGGGALDYYLDYDAVDDPAVTRSAIEEVAAGALRRLPHVARVYTRTMLETGRVNGDLIDHRIVKGFHREESGDLVVVHDPYWLAGRSGTTHGSPYSYDTHVPLLFLGAPDLLRPGRYHGRALVNDIAPTLANLLGIATPSGSTGRVLQEMIP